MANPPPIARKTDLALDQLRAIEQADGGAADLAALDGALRHASPHVIARAARLVGDRRVHALEGAVQAALLHLLDKGADADPGCGAKLGLAEALDLLESVDPTPFERGVVVRQLEASWRLPVDTAKGLRARCGYALARQWGPDALLVLADLLADEEPAVRREATRAIAHAGGPGAIALLRFKVRSGDPDLDDGPDVVGEAMAALAALDPDSALVVARDLLRPPAGRRRDAAAATTVAIAIAIGEARLAAALPLLIAWYQGLEATRDQQAAITAIAVLRCDGAREWLLGRVAAEGHPLAGAALRALAIYRYQDGTEVAARRAATRNRDVDLGPLLDEVFGD